MLRQLVDIGVFDLNTEPLDEAIERRLKHFWGHTTCPRCGNPSIRTWESSDRVCCRNYDLSRYTPTEHRFTRSTSPAERCFSRSFSMRTRC